MLVDPKRHLILGRSYTLWAAVVAAILQAVPLFTDALTLAQLAALDGVILLVLGIVANEIDPRSVGTFARTTTPPPPTVTPPGPIAARLHRSKAGIPASPGK